MDESLVDTKPVISVETNIDSIETNVENKSNSDPKESIESNERLETNEEQIADTFEQRIESEEKMDTESNIETDKDLPQVSVESIEPKDTEIEDNNSGNQSKNTNNDNEVAVEETNGVEVSKGSEAVVEPMPDISVKSPSDISSFVEKIPSPQPVPSATPPRSTNKKPKVDLTAVPVRQYLDTTVVPILLQGLSSLAKERPIKPITYLANFLLEKANEYDDE